MSGTKVITQGPSVTTTAKSTPLSLDGVDPSKFSSLYDMVCAMGPEEYNAWVWHPKTRDSGLPLFASPLMDALSKAPWWHPPVVWLPVLWAVWAYADPNESWAYFAWKMLVGLAVWTVTEYMVHRYVFHMKPQSKDMIAFHFLAHGYHHLMPFDGDRLVIPTPIAMIVGLVVWLVCLATTGSVAGAVAPYTGFGIGYISYDVTHYWLHTPYVPRWVDVLRRRHMSHHFRDHEQHFAISVPTRMWDLFCGTGHDTEGTVADSVSPSVGQ